MSDLNALFAGWPAVSLWQRMSRTDGPVTDILSRVPLEKRQQLTSRRRLSSGSLAGLFSPIRVNPSDSARTAMLLDTFVFAGEAGAPSAGRQGDSDAINWSSDRLDRFVTDVIDAAKELGADLRREPIDRRSRQGFSLVLGEKGIGKTHLQNFILSRYSKDFDDAGVVWVRISLTRSFGADTPVDITAWVRAQIAKVLCRYYDHRSAYCKTPRPSLDIDFRLALGVYIESRPFDERDKADYRRRMNLMLERLQAPNKDTDISPTWIDPLLADQVFAVAREKGLSFVVVLDGMDQLTSSGHQRERFDTRRSAVATYLAQESQTPCYHLWFMRDDSLRRVREDLEGPTALPAHQRDVPLYRAAPAPTSILIDKRLSFATKHYSETRASEFAAYLKTNDCGILSKSGERLTFLAAISGLAGINARSVTQLVTLAATHFVGDSSDGSSSGYLFTESAMMGLKAFPPESYVYQREAGVLRLRHVPNDPRVHDTLFLPPVGVFPHEYHAPALDVFSVVGIESYVWSVRVLQAVKYAQDDLACALQLNDLVSLLQLLFDYSPDRTLLLVEEMCDVELLQTSSVRSAAVASPENSYLHLTSKGRSLLDRYLTDVTYLGVSAFTVPVPDGALPDLEDPIGLFQARAFSVDQLVDWVTAKLQNAFSLAHLMSAANERQRRRVAHVPNDSQVPWFNKDIAQMYESFRNPEHEIFGIGRAMLEDVPKISERVLSGLKESERTRVIDNLRAIADGLRRRAES